MGEPWAPRSFLADLKAPTREEMLRLGVRREFQAGRRLLSEGDETDHVELLLRGFVKITSDAEGSETLLAIRVPGDVVGETAVLTGRPRMASVTACGPVTSAVIHSGDFKRFLAAHPDAAVSIAATIGERLRWANKRRTDFAAHPPETRLARVFADLALSCGRATSAGTVLDVPLTQPELASMVGVAEATVQRALRDLRASGAIATGYRRITIPDIAALHAAADLD